MHYNANVGPSFVGLLPMQWLAAIPNLDAAVERYYAARCAAECMEPLATMIVRARRSEEGGQYAAAHNVQPACDVAVRGLYEVVSSTSC